MRTETFTGNIENAYGNPLPKAIKFNGEFDAFGPAKDVYTSADWDAAVAEIREKNEFPNNEEITNFVNNKRKANARQKTMQAALEAAGIQKPTLEDSPELRWKTMVKTLLAAKKTQAEAESIASAALDYTPAAV
jgi:hypothetical protein